LQKKDKELLVEIIRENRMLLVVGDGRTTTFHHPRFGHQADKRGRRRNGNGEYSD
jgi:hypothetical protein